MARRLNFSIRLFSTGRGQDHVKLFFTPPVLTVLVTPIPVATVAQVIRGLDDAILILGIGWMFALFSTVLWILFVLPLITLFGRQRSGEYCWRRVVTSSCMGGFCVGVLLGALWGWFSPAAADHIARQSVLISGFAHSYVALIGSFFLMHDPFFRKNEERI